MSDVVGSASFELRATRDKISSDMEAARQEILAATKKAEADLAGVVGTGVAEGNKKGAASFEAPKAAANDASNAIKASMQAAGVEIAAAIKTGSDKAKADLESLAAKAREVQTVPKAWVPDDAYRKATNAPYVPIQPMASPTPNISAPALKQTSEAAKETAKNLGSVGEAGGVAEAGLGRLAGGAAGLGITLGAVVGVIGLVAGAVLKLGQDGIKLGDDIAKSAKNIGIGTDALQTWRFVAQQSGADAADADRALDSFATKLSQATAGTSKEAVKAFKLIQIGPEQLKSFKSTEEAIDFVTDRIKGLKSEADRAAVSEALGLGPLSNALKDNATDVAALRDEAMALGVVMDQELIKRASAAQGELDTLSQVVSVQLKSAFIDIAPALITAIGLVAQLATALSNAMDGWRQLEDRTSRGLKSERDSIIADNTRMFARYGRNMPDRPSDIQVVGASGSPAGPGASFSAAAAMPSVKERWDDNVRRLGQINGILAERAATATPPRQDRPTGGTLTLPPPRPGRQDHTKDREARRAERVEQEIFRAKQRLLGVADEETMSAQERFDLAQDRLKLEREARDVEIKSKTTRGEFTQAEAQQLTAANQKADNLEDSVLLDRSFREIQNEQIAAQQVLLAFVNQRLSLEADGALTEKERREVEKEILKLRQKERRAALERAVNDQTASPAERSAARKNLGQLDKMESAENSNFDMSSTGARMGVDAIDGVRERARWVEEAADAYAAIDKLREKDRISEEEAAQAKAKINADLNEKRLASASDFFGNLTILASSSNANLAAIGKAAGIAQATIDGVVAVQKAWASAPFPFNLPAVAATTVAVAANVATIAGVGFAEGGYTGDGSKYEPAGTVHKGEYVFDAAATRRIGVEKLHALRFGHLPGFADGGFVGLDLPGMSIPAIAGTARTSGRALNFDLRGAVMTSDILRQMEGMAAATHGAAVRDARRAAPHDIARRDRFKLGRNED